VEFLRQLLNGTGQAWGKLSVSARINLALAAFAAVGLVVFTVVTASTPQYVRLYDHLDPQETAKVVEVLQAEGISYKLADGEQSILVRAGDRSRTKMAVAAKGLPTNQGAAPGFEMFKEQDLLANRWLQDVRYMRAVQGELQRQLNEFEFVNKSFVFIRESKEELFSSQQKPSEAAVTLDLKRGLSKGEVKAVLHTVSSFGGANLNTENVTLVATDGTVLHLPPSSDFASVANSNLEYVAELERQREERVLRDFEQMGVRALVRVSAVVDFDSTTETSRKSEDGAVVSSYTTTSSTTSKEAVAQGAPGATANLPEGAVAPGQGETSDTTEETIENFEPSSTETKTVKSPGKVKQFLVSAIIEGETKKTQGADGKETEEYVGLTPEKKKIYEDYIAAAVGSGETPTKITVNDQAFTIGKLGEARETFRAIEGAKWIDTIMQWASRVVQATLIVLLFFLARRFLLRAIVKPVEESEEAVSLEPALPSPEDLRREQVSGEVARLSTENPEAIVALLRTWMAQEEE